MAVEHEVKCWPTYYSAIERGEKTFDVRRDDRGYQKGDFLLLQKYDPSPGTGYIPTRSNPYALRRKVIYILTGGQLGIEPGYVVLGLKKVEQEGSPKCCPP